MTSKTSKSIERIVFAFKASIEGDDSFHFAVVDFPEGAPTEAEAERAQTAAKGKVLDTFGVDLEAAVGSTDLDFDLRLLATLSGGSIHIDEDPEPGFGLSVGSHVLAPYSNAMEWEEDNWAVGEAFEAGERQAAAE
jgi:hypothetical protein